MGTLSTERNGETSTDTPRTIEHVFGLRRSGHHAIIGWLASCHEAVGETVHHENSVFNQHLNMPPHWPDPTPEVVWRRGRGHDVLVVNYEDVDFAHREESPTYAALQSPAFGQIVRDTLVVRDWFNFAASRLKYQAEQAAAGRLDSLMFGLEWPALQDRWLQYAQIAASNATDPTCINYNNWYAQGDYRVEIASAYGLPNSDATLDAVPEFGSGSSFEGTATDGHGSGMNVLRRWENLDEGLVDRYKRLISNPVLGKINRELFDIDQEEVLSTVGTY
jgi:hypothetical protein